MHWVIVFLLAMYRYGGDYSLPHVIFFTHFGECPSQKHGYVALMAYRVSDTYPTRIRRGYAKDMYPGRVRELGRIGPGNLRFDTYLVGYGPVTAHLKEQGRSLAPDPPPRGRSRGGEPAPDPPPRGRSRGGEPEPDPRRSALPTRGQPATRAGSRGGGWEASAMAGAEELAAAAPDPRL